MIVIEKQIVADNGATVSHHFVKKAEISPDGDAIVLYIDSWPSEQSRLESRDPIARASARLPLADLLNPLGLIEAIKERLIATDGPLFGGVALTAGPSRTLQELKLIKNAEINAARHAANQSFFTYSGKQIACDALSRSDIEGINGIIANIGTLPVGFPGAWKAMDNSFVPIPDTATWALFYGAMVSKGLANFAHSQVLKGQLAAATTPAEVAAITWGSGPNI